MAVPASLLAVCALLSWSSIADAGQDWLPPRVVSLVAPNATLLPGQPRSLGFVLRANGQAANLRWTATPSGPFVAVLSATSGTVSLAANQTMAIPLTVTVPLSAPDPSTGFITFKVFYDPGTGKAAPDVVSMIRAATAGRPEFYPNPPVGTFAAGGPVSVLYTLHSTAGTSDVYDFSITRSNPDANNSANVVPYTVPSPVTLPAGATIQVSMSGYLPGNIYPGNLNAFSLLASNADDTKLSDARGFAMATSADPDSLPATFYPVGTVPQEQATAGRDGPVPVPGRGLLLVASGNLGVSVVKDSVMGQIGPIDTDANGLDDRNAGRIRPPTYSASIAVVPSFVTSSNVVMDLGLLAAGRGGLMLIDLRDIVDYPGAIWQDWYDQDGDGIDDRILRRIPVGGFATDVEWYRTPEGRVVALVAAADTGSAPTSIGYNPALTVPGTGAGIVAIDVLAALDSLPGVPFIAGVQPTDGDALDLELRGGPDPELAVADGANGVAFYSLASTGTPASITFTPTATIPLNGTWGLPHARDLAWITVGGDSLYLSVASGAGGSQVIKVPHGQPPFLAIAQRVEAPAIGTAGAGSGLFATALGATGATLLLLPAPSELQKISPFALPPYQAPIVLDLGSAWGGRPLRAGLHGTFSSGVTSMRFRNGGSFPDLLCADAARTLALRPGQASVVAVHEPPPAPALGMTLRVLPNPTRGRTEFRLWSGPAGGGFPAGDAVEFAIHDLQGRRVRRISSAPTPSGGGLPWVVWDGRDDLGRAVAPGCYWVRATHPGGWIARAGFVVLR